MKPIENDQLKEIVRDFWDEKSCGEVYAEGLSDPEYYQSHSKARYDLEPYIPKFARFEEGADKDVLEVGVGMGADHVEWAKSKPRTLTGIDLTPRAVEHTKKRLSIFGFTSYVSTGDAENLSFENETFDIVYSWGVLHHSPKTEKAIHEVYRVLRKGGIARIMIYHKSSLTGYMLWLRYGLFKGKPLLTLADVYATYLESPGTKAYTLKEAKSMFKQFSIVSAKSQLSFGDLLQGEVGQRHIGFLLTTAKKLWPRWFFKTMFKNHGLNLMIEAIK